MQSDIKFKPRLTSLSEYTLNFQIVAHLNTLRLQKRCYQSVGGTKSVLAWQNGCYKDRRLFGRKESHCSARNTITAETISNQHLLGSPLLFYIQSVKDTVPFWIRVLPISVHLGFSWHMSFYNWTSAIKLIAFSGDNAQVTPQLEYVKCRWNSVQ